MHVIPTQRTPSQ